MPRFFENLHAEVGDEITLCAENSSHIARSLRMTVGDEITVCSGGIDYGCKIICAEPDRVCCRVAEVNRCAAEPSVKATLFQCVPKGDKLEYVIQKAVELGVSEIVPVLSERCVSRPDEKSAAKKNIRYNKIAKSACEQSGRGIIVNVRPMISYAEAVKEIADFDKVLFFYEGGGEPLTESLCTAEKIAVLIGPEGGFDEKEVKAAVGSGAVCATLGKRILRTETAPLAALTAVMLLSGNMR